MRIINTDDGHALIFCEKSSVSTLWPEKMRIDMFRDYKFVYISYQVGDKYIGSINIDGKVKPRYTVSININLEAKK